MIKFAHCLRFNSQKYFAIYFRMYKNVAESELKYVYLLFHLLFFFSNFHLLMLEFYQSYGVNVRLI